MKDISKKDWKRAFVKWANLIISALSKKWEGREESCGYCRFAGPCTGCALLSVCDFFKDSYVNTAYKKWHHERYNPKPIRWKLVLRWSRQILQAIIDDGRRLGYVGEKEEVKIKEVIG